MNSDTALIRDGLGARLEQVLDCYAPGWIGARGIAYPAPKNKQDLGSFQVQLRAPRRGNWFRFSAALGGGPVQLLSYLISGTVDSYRDAFSEARRFLGMTPQTEEAQQAAQEARRLAWERGRLQREAEVTIAAQQAARRQDGAFQVETEIGPPQGTIIGDYFQGRGLDMPPHAEDAIGFHRCLMHESGQRFPAMVGRVLDISGELTGIWRTWIDPLTAKKADVANPKMALGLTKGGAVRFGGVGPKIAVAEGIETACAVGSLIGWKRPVWAALSTSGMAALEIPFGVEHVSIFPDGDLPIRRVPGSDQFEPNPNPPGITAARKLSERLTQAGIKNVINQPPTGGDYLDTLNSVGGAHA